MSKNMINSTHVEGYIYEHKLEKKVSGENSKKPGTEFISGTLSIATDDAMTNVVPVHFTYVTELTAKGNPNATWNALMGIINGTICNVMEHGRDKAGKVRIDSALALNEWYDSRNNNNTLVSTKRNEGGFVHMTSDLNLDESMRSTFNTDMLITGTKRIEADDKGNPEKMTIKGCIFDFRKSLLPVEFTVLNPRAMDYFEDLECSNTNPTFTRIQGEMVSKTVIKEVKEENAFGEAKVKQTRNTQRDFVVTWASPEPYLWDDESTLLASELTEMIAAREMTLANIKKRQDEYQASKGSAFAAPAAATSTSKVYNF